MAIVLSWLIGATAIHLAERRANPDFATWADSLWSVWVLLFSGLGSPPKTVAGRLVTMILLVLGVGLAGLFTASVASLLIERYLRRRDVESFEMADHLVLCNWSPRGQEWIREVHAKTIQDKRPVVIIHDETDEIDLPDKQDEPAFSDVYIVKGDPTSEVVLRRAKVPTAHSVVILIDDREGKHADGKSILTCIAVRNVCRGQAQPNVAAECRNPANRHHLKKAGADEVISPNDSYYEVEAKVQEYLDAGVRLIWVLNPDLQSIKVYEGDSGRTFSLSAKDELTGGNVVPGFRCPVSSLFPASQQVTPPA